MPSRQSGVSLVEVMVAVLVFAVGLLGVAALQGLSLQGTQTAFHRTQALNLASEVADFARVNRSLILGPPCAVPDSVLEGWRNLAARQLPGGRLGLDFRDCAAGEIRIAVSWGESRLTDAPIFTDGIVRREDRVVIITRI